MSATNSWISTRKICPSVKNSINIQQIIILLVSIYQISRKIQPCFPMDKQKKGKKKKFQLAEISIPSVISSRLIEPERGKQNTMEWNKGSHGREIVPFSRLNFIMRGEIESRRSITRGSREIPRRFSRPTPPSKNSSHSRLAFSVSVENLACGGCASTCTPADTKSRHVRSCKLATIFRPFLLSKTFRFGQDAWGVSSERVRRRARSFAPRRGCDAWRRSGIGT